MTRPPARTPPDPVRYAVALSEHPDTGIALGEVVGQVLDRLGPSPDVAVLFLTGHHIGQCEEVGRTVRRTLGVGHLIGGTAVSVLAHRQEVEESPGLVLWAGQTGPVDVFRLSSEGFLPDGIADGTAVVALADPFSFDGVGLADGVPGGVTLIGGLASAAGGPGGNRLLLDDELYRDGAVALALPPGLGARPLVSQGCRPLGEPMTVTSSEGNLLRTLGGRPALDRLKAIADAVEPSDRVLLSRGLHVGLVIDEHREVFGPGDFLIRGVLGADRSTGALAIGDHAPVGSTVQFQIRDADAASVELRDLAAAWRADSALAFTCNGRGSNLYGRPGPDAEALVDGLETTAVAGMFCAGEIGPIGGRHFLHGFTASALLLGAEPAA
ncbi:MAG: FIST C-terminal domain-containing protein [Actinobacteria bacterium]|nr:FIST C-terminal domain-containing protein [Actinomycetota bacterium]